MMSNPPMGIQARQRQHRRQNSTPSAFGGSNITQVPNPTNRRTTMAHRRGHSLDIRRFQTNQHTARQDLNKVRIATNMSGLANTSQHHILQEAQQQRIQARPGPQQLQYASLAANDCADFLISPHGTPQSQRFDASCFNGMPIPFPCGGSQWNFIMQKNHENFANNMAENKYFDIYSNDSALSTPTFMNFPGSPAGQAWSTGDENNSRRNSRRISDGIMERVNKFENMGTEELQRPTTPSNQNGKSYYPPTPMDTPHDRMAKQQARPERFSGDYDESTEETIRPNRNKRPDQRPHSTFAEMRQQTEQNMTVCSPPGTNTIPDAKTFNNLQIQNREFMSMGALQSEFVRMEDASEMLKYESDVVQSSLKSSRRTSPETQEGEQLDRAGLESQPGLQPVPRSGSSESSRRTSPHRRTESVASIVSAASIADIVIEETRTDTGVTLEEISQYILSPETTDGKWTCLFEDCGKKFGRKENIKSHVQTHLNDRQYQCPTCQKCFVRQHDLKRHAKIHTGVKPYPCECGNSFARHDALTRHRQRGMCIGAFDGVVRKVVKRGRPRKNRPDLDSRLEKSARTRKKNLSISSASSLSGYSDSSSINSPENDFNIIEDMMELQMASNRTQAMQSMSTAPMPAFAQRNINNAVTPSPSIVSVQSYVSPEVIMDPAPSDPATPAKSTTSHYNTPPELSQSSSPPPAQFFDLDSNNSTVAEELAVMSSTSGMMETSDMHGTLPMGMDEQDDLLLQFSQDDSLVQLDRDTNMLLLTKFDDEFDDTVNMFTNNDDMFFANA